MRALEGTGGRVERGYCMGNHTFGADFARVRDAIANLAVLVDRAEQRLMTLADVVGAAVMMGAADIDEVSLRGEWLTERSAVGSR